MKREVIGFYIDADLKKRFLKYCKDHSIDKMLLIQVMMKEKMEMGNG